MFYMGISISKDFLWAVDVDNVYYYTLCVNKIVVYIKRWTTQMSSCDFLDSKQHAIASIVILFVYT